MSVETVRYGSWKAYGDPHWNTVEGTVINFITVRDTDWCHRARETGAIDQMTADYRAAINAALPHPVRLEGDIFYGPASPVDFTWEHGELDLRAIVKSVDLAAIVEANDPDL